MFLRYVGKFVHKNNKIAQFQDALSLNFALQGKGKSKSECLDGWCHGVTKTLWTLGASDGIAPPSVGLPFVAAIDD